MILIVQKRGDDGRVVDMSNGGTAHLTFLFDAAILINRTGYCERKIKKQRPPGVLLAMSLK